ncbi:putative Periplasmic protein TonB, links inner and outer membranes [Rhodospirillaceae bacterium LM-1]|nr:putative Periplasmic protein TonB, links inner and outer membranes [Rhodospirillaceae bacterium LM-1]
MSDKLDRERLEPELGQDLLDILPDRGLGRSDRETLSARPLPRKKRRGFLLWFLLFFLASGAAVATWWVMSRGQKIVGGSSVEVPLVKADERSYKSKPSQPGGMDVPDQDKMVYDRMGNAQETGKPAVERLLPMPEAPLAPPAPVAPTPPAATVLPDLPRATVTESPKATPPSMRDVAPPEPPPVEPPPLLDDEKPGAKPTLPKAALPPKPVAKIDDAAAKAAVKSSPGGAWLVQLGAIKEETAAARQWQTIQKANADLLGGLSLDVQKADLGAKGTFYRLRAGSLDSKEAAKALCDQLAARKQGCIVVRK